MLKKNNISNTFILLILMIISITLYMCKPDNIIDSGDSGDSGDAGSDIFPEGTFIINNNDEYTNSYLVVLDLSGIYDASQMRFANTQEEIDNSNWENYSAEKNWNLDTEDGIKTVYGEFKNEYDNILSVDDSIILDTQPPSGTFYINNGSDYTSSKDVNLDMSSVVDAIEMRFGNTHSEISNATWQNYIENYTWTLLDGDGSKTVYAEFKDIAGNIYQTEDDIILSTTPPSGTFTINNDNNYTNNINVNLELDNISDAIEMRFGNTETERDNAAWQTFSNNHKSEKKYV